ncbi:MAG: hypothetical protein FWC02_03750 [Firmicutes bacterium]|nr:hypothetical protein [Bacillota bacterium]
MKNYLAVLKILIRNNYFPTKEKGQKSDKGRIALVVSLAVLVVVFAPILIVGVFFSAPVVYDLGLANEFIVVILAIASLLVLFFGVVAMLGYLYFSRDTEFFLSLPIKPSTIFMAKFTIIYVTELVIAALILFPTLITFGVAIGAQPTYYIFMIFGILFAPALPLMVASLLSIPIMYVVSFFKNRGAWASVFLILLVGTIFGFYFYFIQTISVGDGVDIEGMIESMADGMRTFAMIVYPFLAFARAATSTASFGLSVGSSVVVNLLIFVVSIVTLVLIANVVSNLVYRRSASVQLEGKKRVVKGNENFISSSPLSSLVKKEWRGIIRTPAFAYQCLMPLVLTPIMIGVMGFMGGGIGGNGYYDNGIDFSPHFQYFMLFLFVLMFSGAMNMTALSAITRDGQSVNLSKMLPVSYQKQVQAKLAISFILSVIPGLLGIVIINIITFDFANMMMSVVFFALFAYAFSCFGIFNDLRKPKLDWTTPNQAMRQNMNLVVPMLLGMLASVVFFGIGLTVILVVQNDITSQLVSWGVLIGLGFVLAVLFHFILFKNAERLFERISV